MTKRKYDLSSIIGEAPEIPLDGGSGEAVNQSATRASNSEVPQAYVADEVANEPANWTQGPEGQLASLEGDTEAQSHNRFTSQGNQSAAVGVDPGIGGPVQSTLTAEVESWLRATKAPAANPPVGLGLEVTETEDEARHRHLMAFWALLLAAGYEEV